MEQQRCTDYIFSAQGITLLERARRVLNSKHSAACCVVKLNVRLGTPSCLPEVRWPIRSGRGGEGQTRHSLPQGANSTCSIPCNCWPRKVPLEQYGLLVTWTNGLRETKYMRPTSPAPLVNSSSGKRTCTLLQIVTASNKLCVFRLYHQS